MFGPLAAKRDATDTLADSRLSAAGSVVVGKHKGQEIRVLVLSDGFEYEGQRFRFRSATTNWSLACTSTDFGSSESGAAHPECPVYRLQQVRDPKFSYPTAAQDRIVRVQLKSIRRKRTGEIKQLRATVQEFESTICRSECVRSQKSTCVRFNKTDVDDPSSGSG